MEGGGPSSSTNPPTAANRRAGEHRRRGIIGFSACQSQDEKQRASAFRPAARLSETTWQRDWVRAQSIRRGGGSESTLACQSEEKAGKERWRDGRRQRRSCMTTTPRIPFRSFFFLKDYSSRQPLHSFREMLPEAANW